MLEHFVTNVGKLREKMLRKNVGNTSKNVDEKMLTNFQKMLTRKYVGNTSENVDEKCGMHS
jgi:hypothetical protein